MKTIYHFGQVVNHVEEIAKLGITKQDGSKLTKGGALAKPELYLILKDKNGTVLADDIVMHWINLDGEYENKVDIANGVFEHTAIHTIEDQMKAHIVKKANASVHVLFGRNKGDAVNYTFLGVWRKTSDDFNAQGEKIVYKLNNMNFEVPDNCASITNED